MPRQAFNKEIRKWGRSHLIPNTNLAVNGDSTGPILSPEEGKEQEKKRKIECIGGKIWAPGKF